MASREKKNTPSTSKEVSPPRCIFCHAGDDEKRYGPMVEAHGLAAHNFCMLFSSGLAQQGDDSEGLLGFLPQDVKKEKQRSRSLKCAYCKKRSASIGCSEPRCRRSYHYGCGKDQGCMYLYYDDFRTYCKNHRVEQEDLTIEEKEKQTEASHSSCFICYEPLTPAISHSTILSPCCTRAWYHRPCLEDMAYSAGLHYFKCPLCNNIDEWQAEMLSAGIYIPDRDASWELEPNAYNSLLETNTECEAEECLCSQGRREDQDHGPWELILCDSCGSQACHRACGTLKRKDREWLCRVCRNAVPDPQPENPKRKCAATSGRARRPRGIQEVTNVVQ